MAVTWTTTPPASTDYATYYGTYTKLVPEGDILSILAAQIDDTSALLAEIGEQRGGHRYAPGKWSIKEVMGHVIDVERIFAVRALWFARSDQQPLPGMEQDDYVAAANFDGRPLADLAEEYRLVRASNVALFRTFDDETAARRGIASGVEFTAGSIPYVLAGHELHHVGLLKDRYV